MSSLEHGPFGEEDEAINLCRQQAFLGTFRVRVDNVTLPGFSAREVQHVKRLEEIFQVQGCFRLDSRNRAEATINSSTWRSVSVRSSLEAVSHRVPPELHIGTEETLSCFSGKCRLAAARGVLDGLDRWWPVSIYREGKLDNAAKFPFLTQSLMGHRRVGDIHTTSCSQLAPRKDAPNWSELLRVS